MPPASPLADLDAAEAPSLVLDEARMLRNIARLRDRLRALRVAGCDLAVILDTPAQARAVVAASADGAMPVLWRSTATAIARD